MLTSGFVWLALDVTSGISCSDLLIMYCAICLRNPRTIHFQFRSKNLSSFLVISFNSRLSPRVWLTQNLLILIASCDATELRRENTSDLTQHWSNFVSWEQIHFTSRLRYKRTKMKGKWYPMRSKKGRKKSSASLVESQDDESAAESWISSRRVEDTCISTPLSSIIGLVSPTISSVRIDLLSTHNATRLDILGMACSHLRPKPPFGTFSYRVAWDFPLLQLIHKASSVLVIRSALMPSLWRT